MNVATFVCGPLRENCHLVSDPATGAAAIIDPGDDGDALVAAIREAKVTLEAIWVTHGHLDHIGGIAAVRRAYDVPIFLHRADLTIYREGGRAAVVLQIPFEDAPAPTAWFTDGMQLVLGGLAFTVMHAPGHSPGHVVIHGEGAAFVGDCLFAGSVGRTDLPWSDPAALRQSLARIAQLPAETVVRAGHGPETTIGIERRSNPFLTGAARPVAR